MATVLSERNLSALLVIVLVMSIQAAAQKSPPNPLPQSPQRDDSTDPRELENVPIAYRTAPGTCVILLTVFAERPSSHLDRQAVLKLVRQSDQSAVWQTTDDRARGVFTDIPYGKYDLEVNAVGYLSEHKEIDAIDSTRPAEVAIVLQRDPAAINLDVASTIMTPKARREAKRAINLLKSGKLTQAQKQLADAYQRAPSSPELNFLLGYLYFQANDLARASTYLGSATALNPGNAQALTLLGRTELERKEYRAARSALEQAVLADPDNWIPHSLLADTYLHQQSFDKARDEARLAITKGKVSASPAQVILGEALVDLGDESGGIQTLNAFLEEFPNGPVADQVRAFVSGVQPSSISPPQQTPSISEAQVPVIDPLPAVPAPPLSVKPWHPPGIDDVKPATVAGVICPAAKVVEESGKRVEELVADVSRFAAVEDLFHQSLDSYGIPTRTQTRKYNYVATISETDSGYLEVDEYRTDKITIEEFPDEIASTGFAALALVFHPRIRDDFEMACEGLGDWKGEATWLVRFRQRADHPNHMHSYRIGKQTYTVGLKGRAWITADKLQIVRIEAEMVQPMPEIQLLGEHQVVEYGPVPFPRKNTTLWLPKTAEIYFDFRRHHYYRRHSFDHYMLFAVDTEEKRKEPAAKPSSEKRSRLSAPESLK